jgi:uncharacterized membrane protein
LETVSLLVGTVLLRPYVFAFLAVYLFLASRQIGWTRTIAWTIAGYAVAFAAEYGSVHWGVPFGDYYYIPATQDRELWIAGVPFMDSLSFTFLSYTGFTCAWQIVAAWKTGPFLRHGSPADPALYQGIRRSPAVLVVGALITTLLDVIIDPVALMGERWFLGKIYGYRHEGFYFGVPLANFVGWFAVSAAIIVVHQILDRWLPQAKASYGARPIPYLALGGFALFFFVAAFNLAVALWLGAWGVFLAGAVLAAGFLFAALRIVMAGRLFPMAEASGLNIDRAR